MDAQILVRRRDADGAPVDPPSASRRTMGAGDVIAWLTTWLGGLTLRLKLYALAALAVTAALGYLWLRWKIAARRASTAQDKADKLEQTRRLEQRIASSQAALRARQAKVRAEILARSGKRDYFER